MLTLIVSLGAEVSFAGCSGKFANPLTDVCWSCLFPLTIGNSTVFNGDKPDTDNPSSPLCACSTENSIVRVGLTSGFWEPIALVDVTRHPYCMVNLGGYQLSSGNELASGEIDASDSAQGGSFYYVHWYKFPLLYWLNLLTDGLCIEHGDMDIAYLTELDPTWHDDELTLLLNPEAALLGSFPAQMACATDSVSSLAEHPIDKLFWCAGSQGSLYPLSGRVQEHVGGVQASQLLTERMDYKMHREGLLWDSSESYSQICHQHLSAMIPKSRYRFQMINPIPTSSGGNDGCHAFGHSTSTWGAMHEFPVTGEDFGYLVWRKRNCCMW